MSKEMSTTVPDKYCPKCRNKIPLNGEHNAITGELLKTPRLACEHCARAAAPSPPPKPRPLRKGETPEGQHNFLSEVPWLVIGNDGK